MSKLVYSTVLLVLIALTGVVGGVFYRRINLNYNEEGRYLDPETMLVYDKDGLLVYGILLLLLVILTILTGLKIRNVKKEYLMKNYKTERNCKAIL